MAASTIYEVIGYIGSALVILSLTQKSILKLRLIGLAGAVFFVVYSLLIGAIPILIVNASIIVIHIYFLRGLLKADTDYFEVLRVRKESRYLEHFLEFYDEDLHRFHPEFTYTPSDDQVAAFVLRDLVPAGLFIGEMDDHGTLHVKLDYVIPQYRDLKIGQYLYSRSGFMEDLKCDCVMSVSGSHMHTKYLEKMGFVADTTDTGDSVYVKDLH